MILGPKLTATAASSSSIRTHGLWLGDKQIDTPTLLFGSIRFVADHCPLLVFLSFEILDEDSKRAKSSTFLPLTSAALQKLVKQCTSLEVIGVRAHARIVCTSENGDIVNGDEVFWEEKQPLELKLTRIPMHAREDAVKLRCRTTVKEIIDSGGVIQFCDTSTAL